MPNGVVDGRLALAASPLQVNLSYTTLRKLPLYHLGALTQYRPVSSATSPIQMSVSRSLEWSSFSWWLASCPTLHTVGFGYQFGRHLPGGCNSHLGGSGLQERPAEVIIDVYLSVALISA